MKALIFSIVILQSIIVFSQDKKPELSKVAVNQSKNLTYEANKLASEKNFIDAEANYRKAISKNNKNAVARYNLGNQYYKKNSMGEAFNRFKEAGETANAKPEKHQAYHNLGNVFMNKKDYANAVEAYKQALRNNPNDEETRYNLALAKEMLKKQQNENKDNKKDDKEKDQNQDNKDQQNQQNQDNKDNNEGKGDNDKMDEPQKPNNNNKGDKKEDQKQPEQPKEGEGEKPKPNQLSPQQMKNILEAMNNEEKKVQEKINAQKVKGKPIKPEKDW